MNRLFPVYKKAAAKPAPVLRLVAMEKAAAADHADSALRQVFTSRR